MVLLIRKIVFLQYMSILGLVIIIEVKIQDFGIMGKMVISYTNLVREMYHNHEL